MNILIVARADHSGAGNALKDAINRHTPHTARAVAFRKEWYPVEILSPDPSRLHELVRWADALNVHADGWSVMPRDLPHRPVVRTYHGSWYRAHQKEEDEAVKRNGWQQTCLTMDLSNTGAAWIGRPMPDLAGMYRPPDDGLFHVCHSPSQPARKGTRSIVEALRGLPGVALDVVTGVPNDECLRRKARSHLLVDKTAICPASHGTSALESWAIGTPVVAEIRPWICDLVRKQIGYLPFCLPEGGFRAIVERFRDDFEFYQIWKQIGIDYVRRYHDPKTVAERFVELCRRF